jgi:hypothetical protein
MTHHPNERALSYLHRNAGLVRLHLGAAHDVMAAMPEPDVDCVLRDYASGRWGAGGNRSRTMLARIRASGYPTALVAEDGLECLAVPWPDFDVLFLGGTTAWKLGPAAAALVVEAVRRGIFVHMGRINGLRRMRHTAVIGCQTAAYTYLAYGPGRNRPSLQGWLRAVDQRTTVAADV